VRKAKGLLRSRVIDVAHVDPHEPILLDEGKAMDATRDARWFVGAFRRHDDTGAARVVRPSMIRTADATIEQLATTQGRIAMQAAVAQRCRAARLVAKEDERL